MSRIMVVGSADHDSELWEMRQSFCGLFGMPE